VIGVRYLFVTGTVGQNVALLFEAVCFNLNAACQLTILTARTRMLTPILRVRGGIFGLGILSSGRFDLSFDHRDGL
jgi:hypothetical protein